MIEARYRNFQESTAFDSGYRRALSDLLDILEKTKWTRIIKKDGMELLRVLCVPENLDAVSNGDAKIYRRTNEMVKAGKERYHLHFRIQADEPDGKGKAETLAKTIRKDNPQADVLLGFMESIGMKPVKVETVKGGKVRFYEKKSRKTTQNV